MSTSTLYKTKTLKMGAYTDVVCYAGFVLAATGNKVISYGAAAETFCEFSAPVKSLWVETDYNDCGPAVVVQVGERHFYVRSLWRSAEVSTYHKPHGDVDTVSEKKTCFTSRGEIMFRDESLARWRQMWTEKGCKDMLFAPAESVAILYEDMQKTVKPLPISKALRQLRPGVVAECYLTRVILRSPFIVEKGQFDPQLEEDEHISGVALSDENELIVATNKKLLSISVESYLKKVI